MVKKSKCRSKIVWVCTCLTILISASLSTVAAPKPILEYKFNETGTTAMSTGSDTSGATVEAFYTSYPTTADLHSADGLGISGLSGDRAYDNTASTGMGLAGPMAYTAPPPTSVNQLLSVTLSGWFKTAGTGKLTNGATLISMYDNGSQGFRLRGIETGEGQGALPFFIDSSNVVPTGEEAAWNATQEWVFFAVTYDGTKTANNVYFYTASPTSAPTLVGGAQSINAGPLDDSLGDSLTIASYRGTNNLTFDGYLDNIRIFGSKSDESGVLSLRELQELWSEDTGQPLPPLPPLPSEMPIVEYKFNETGTTALSTGLDTSAATVETFYTSYPTTADLHSADGLGVSGLPGDRAYDNTASAGMGLTGSMAYKAPPPASINGLLSITLSGWFKTAGTEKLTNSAHLMTMFDNGIQGFRLRGIETGEGQGSMNLSIDSSSVVPTGEQAAWDATQEWVFFAVTYDGSLTSNNVYFYVGSKTSAVTQVGGAQSINAGALDDALGDALCIASYRGTNNYTFDGYLDNIRIFGSKTDNFGVLTLDKLELLRARDVLKNCGEPGTTYLDTDLNKDCYVNIEDFSEYALQWQQCTDPNDSLCDSYWKP